MQKQWFSYSQTTQNVTKPFDSIGAARAYANSAIAIYPGSRYLILEVVEQRRAATPEVVVEPATVFAPAERPI